MKKLFITVVLLHIVAITGFLLLKPNTPSKTEEISPETALPQPLSPSTELGVNTTSTQPAPLLPSPSIQTMNRLSEATRATNAGDWAKARSLLNDIVAQHPDPEAVKLLGDVNMQLLKSPLMMPEKEYYVIQSGDYLQKIAKKYNTTVALLKTMNNLSSDTIRLGARLLVFKGAFTISVSKERNELDLLLNGTLFKRYPVGTGKFGKTPAVSFTVVDKIVEPPWTRPTDGQQIEFGDPENVLGTRWMAIKSEDHPELTGFGIHGTWENDSIGKQSSAGCIRMLNEDVEELFDLIPRKTSVHITP